MALYFYMRRLTFGKGKLRLCTLHLNTDKLHAQMFMLHGSFKLSDALRAQTPGRCTPFFQIVISNFSIFIFYDFYSNYVASTVNSKEIVFPVQKSLNGSRD